MSESSDIDISLGDEFETVDNSNTNTLVDVTQELPSILSPNDEFGQDAPNDYDSDYEYQYFEELVPVNNELI